MGKGIQGLSLEEVNFEFTKDRTVILSNVVATSHVWLLIIRKVANEPEEQDFKLKFKYKSPHAAIDYL